MKEQDIVNWLNKIWKIIVDNEDVYHGMSVDEVEKNVKRFYEMLKGELEASKLSFFIDYFLPSNSPFNIS